MAIIVVKTADQKTTKTGKVYLSVVDQGGNQYSCWDTGLWNLFAPKLAVDVEVETKGNFKNIIGASVADEIQQTVDTVEQSGGEVSNVTMVDTKNRSYALSYAKDQVNQMMKDSPELAKKSSKDITKVTISMSRDYEKYLNGED